MNDDVMRTIQLVQQYTEGTGVVFKQGAKKFTPAPVHSPLAEGFGQPHDKVSITEWNTTPSRKRRAGPTKNVKFNESPFSASQTDAYEQCLKEQYDPAPVRSQVKPQGLLLDGTPSYPRPPWELHSSHRIVSTCPTVLKS